MSINKKSKRKEVENYILTYIEKIAGKFNRSIYEDRVFKNMTDEDFDQFMKDLKTEKRFLVIYAPNLKKREISVENNLEVAKELGYNFFQKLWISSNDDVPTYLTPIPYMIIDLPIRRTSQLLIKGISVPDHTKVVDNLTGQPTGESKGAKISYPEVQLMVAMGMEKSALELMKYRGGDKGGLTALNNMVSKLGSANLDTLSAYATGVESTKTLKTFLTGMMLKTTL